MTVLKPFNCHCPGINTGYSGSGGGSGGIITGTCNSTLCNGSVVPITLQLVVSKTGGTDNPACYTNYIGTFICNLVEIVAGTCIWRSSELPMRLSDCTPLATVNNNGRWEIGVVSYTTGPPAQNIQALSYHNLSGAGNFYRILYGVQDAAQTKRNCLASVTTTTLITGTTWTGIITAI